MSSNILLTDLSKNLIVFIYQYLTGKEMVLASSASKKMREAFNQDFLFIELSKRDHLFLPSEGEKFNTWKEYFLYLRQLKTNLKSGKPNIGFKMIPYRGHKSPIESFAIFSNKKEMSDTVVSGDTNGEVITWNVDEDGDKEKDVIFKADSAIEGIKNLNYDSNMIVWTKKNKFYYFSVNMFKKVEKNSERFELEKEFSIDEDDNPIKQLYYDKASSIIFMSPNLRGEYKKTNLYSFDLKTSTLNKYNFDYNSFQKKAVLSNNQNNNNIQQGWNDFNNNLFQPVLHHPINPNFNVYNTDFNNRTKESRQKNENYFIVTEDKVITYINYEPERKRPIAEYINKNNLPNVFVFNKSTKICDSYRIDLDCIYNILPIDNSKVAFIGSNINSNNNKKEVVLKVYYTNFFTISSEIVLYKEQNFKKIDIIYYKNTEVIYLINENILKKIENINNPKLKIINISTLKEVQSINCIEGDEFRIVIASDELYMSIFDIKTGKLWFILLGGSKTVFPKSFVKHPSYEGFHIIKITRNSIYSVFGNLIREYRFTFKYGK